MGEGEAGWDTCIYQKTGELAASLESDEGILVWRGGAAWELVEVGGG